MAKVIESEIYIRNVSDARKCIGQTVYWDDVSNRYVMLRSAQLMEVAGRNVRLGDDDWRWRAGLKNLRNFKEGGEQRDRKCNTSQN